MRPIHHEELFRDPDVVKVVVDRVGYALYFPRAPIPFGCRPECFQLYGHLGLYTYRKDFLPGLARLAPAALGQSEALEQLRVLEHGHRLLAIETQHHLGLSIDAPDDLRTPRSFWLEAAGK
jgi:3-deoxy-manno-octulosonate cytidylyltransferase (CMP-KDO synthetase)